MRPSLLERAFELAGSGRFGGPDAIAAELTREGYADVRRHWRAVPSNYSCDASARAQEQAASKTANRPPGRVNRDV